MRFAFCERVTASPMSLEHIREVGAEGLMLGGGIPNVALCGADVRRGWDLSSEVTEGTVERLATARTGDGHVFLCDTCARLWVIHR